MSRLNDATEYKARPPSALATRRRLKAHVLDMALLVAKVTRDHQAQLALLALTELIESGKTAEHGDRFLAEMTP